MKTCLEYYKKPIGFRKAELYSFAPLQIKTPFYDSTGGPFTTLPLTHWLVLYDEEGVTGQAPCSALMGQVILPLILNGERHTYEQWYNKVYWAIRNRGFAGEAAIELGRLDRALHDMMSKQAGLPLHKFLGAKRDWVHVYASGCGTNLSFKQMEEEVQFFIEQGYSVFKMKVAGNFGQNLDRDVERVRIVRKLIGQQAKLAIDANQIWDAQSALAFIQRVQDQNIAWFEEPVHSYNTSELKKLAPVCPVPIGMGESLRNQYQFHSYIEFGVKQLQPIPSNLSGVRDWFAVRDQAIHNNLELTSGGFSQLTSSFIATAREEDMVEYLYPIMYKLSEIADVCPKEQKGTFILPSVPGNALTLDFKLLDRLGYILNIEYFRPE